MAVRRQAFTLLHKALYGAAIPVLSRTGPLEPTLLQVYRRATHRPPDMGHFPCPLMLDGIEVFYDRGSPSFTVRGLAMGTYERATVALVRRTLASGMCFVDVGAHIGYYSLVAAGLVGTEGRVFSFEPDPRNREILERNISANHFGGHIRVVPKAVGAADGELPLYRDDSDTGSSSLFERVGGGARTVPVGVTTLDHWAESAGWPNVDLMKVDVEGAEGGVLAGMGELARRNPGMGLVVECNIEALGEAGLRPHEFFDSLRDRGFDRIRLIGEHRLRPIEDRRSEAGLARLSRWVPVNLYCQRTY